MALDENSRKRCDEAAALATEEAKEILENIRAIKGDSFTNVVDLIVHQGLALRAIIGYNQSLPPEIRKTVAELLVNMTALSLSYVCEALNFTDKQEREAQEWALQIMSVYDKNRPR